VECSRQPTSHRYLGIRSTGRVLGQHCADSGTRPVPADEVCVQHTPAERVKELDARAFVDFRTTLRRRAQIDQQKQKRVSRALRPDSLDLQEVTERLFVVDVLRAFDVESARTAVGLRPGIDADKSALLADGCLRRQESVEMIVTA